MATNTAKPADPVGEALDAAIKALNIAVASTADTLAAIQQAIRELAASKRTGKRQR